MDLYSDGILREAGSWTVGEDVHFSEIGRQNIFDIKAVCILGCIRARDRTSTEQGLRVRRVAYVYFILLHSNFTCPKTLEKACCYVYRISIVSY